MSDLSTRVCAIWAACNPLIASIRSSMTVSDDVGGLAKFSATHAPCLPAPGKRYAWLHERAAVNVDRASKAVQSMREHLMRVLALTAPTTEAG